jgi:hypothetical protein
MTDRAVEFTAQTYARIAGLLYLIVIVAGGLPAMGVNVPKWNEKARFAPHNHFAERESHHV